jgi:hypothetical protein
VLVDGLWPGGPAERKDLASFLGRAVGLDPAAVVRLRGGDERVTAYVRLPFGVLVSRTVGGSSSPADVTVGAAELLAALDPAGALDQPAAPLDGPADGPAAGIGGELVEWPPRRDVDFRAALPPADGWVPLDSVPGDVIRALVRAGRDALRSVPAGSAAAAGESLLDHESLTVSGSGRTAVLPLRVVGALTRMGFLGGDPAADAVLVSATGGWTRLAAPFGSAYQHAAPALGLTLR